MQEAQAAQQQTNGYSLTKTIAFKVTMFDDFERFGKVPDAYEQPERQAYKPQVGPCPAVLSHVHGACHKPVPGLAQSTGLCSTGLCAIGPRVPCIPRPCTPDAPHTAGPAGLACCAGGSAVLDVRQTRAGPICGAQWGRHRGDVE